MQVYTFGNGQAEGRADMVAELGGKGAALAGMSRMGVPVPPGFTIPAAACAAVLAGDEDLLSLRAEIERGIAHIEAVRGQRLGAGPSPLLVSVRSGASISMPGMMDTILNVGCNPESVAAMGRNGRNRFALDTQRRFFEMYTEVALELDPRVLLSVRDEVLELARVQTVRQLPEVTVSGLISAYTKQLFEHGTAIPDDPREQLRAAIRGVFRSWNAARARRFRRQSGIPDLLGTAVSVQAMVFGNQSGQSGTGVAFTRDPNTGERRLFGEFLADAQGEDVVSGTETPRGLDGEHPGALKNFCPEAYDQLVEMTHLLESHLRDVQDVEFTVEDGELWLLQTRPAQRSVRAAVRVAVEMVDEGVIDQDEALRRIDPEGLSRLLHPSVDTHARRRVLARGLPASPGAVSGIAIFDPMEAIRRAQNGERVILVRVETSTDDMDAIRAVNGVLTSRGGMTSHAALVARGIGRACVTGCADLLVQERRGCFTVRNQSTCVEAGDWITLDGSTGEVILGEAATTPADPPPAFPRLMAWADARRVVSVRANADHSAEARDAIAQGADGIGLCRTEHMFLEKDRAGFVHELVFANNKAARQRVVQRLLPLQREDFEGIFAVTGELPVAIRLLDVPLHDVVGTEPDLIEATARRLGQTVAQVANRARRLRAANPLMGHRGCRLGLTFPEVYEVQVRAVFEAATRSAVRPNLQIVIPLVTGSEELRRLRRRIDKIAAEVEAEQGCAALDYAVGPMVESPRACLLADELAEYSDFFLFGTNDLTAATFFVHRDDAGRYLPFYLENKVLAADPFVELDRAVIHLIKFAIQAGRRVKPGLPCGLSGAHGSMPDTVIRSQALGLDYVTSAAHRVPIARLAAAQAAIA